MKNYFPTVVLVTLMSLPGIKLAASESFTLETHVYVYRNSDFLAVQIPGAPANRETHGTSFGSPAVARFDQEELSLNGDRFTWSGGDKPSD